MHAYLCMHAEKLSIEKLFIIGHQRASHVEEQQGLLVGFRIIHQSFLRTTM